VIAAETPLTPESAHVLQRLRASLERLSAADPRKPAEEDIGEPLTPLVGLSRAQISVALGDPHVCAPPFVGPDNLCPHERDWYYSFHRLPEGFKGGGPELVLEFDRNDRCVSAKVVFTQ
jgi:hypothetical protein